MDKGKKSDLDIQREVQDLRIGARIRKPRHRRSLTLQDVSNISGLSKSLLSVQFAHKTADNQLYYHSGEEFIFIQHGQVEFIDLTELNNQTREEDWKCEKYCGYWV